MRKLWLGLMAVLCAPVIAGNLHEQIDECDSTRDEKCVREIFHQLAKQELAGKKLSWCTCEPPVHERAHMLYLHRTLPDGSKSKNPLISGEVSPADCTGMILTMPACK